MDTALHLHIQGGQTAAINQNKWWCGPVGHTGKLRRGLLFREHKDGTEDNGFKVKPGWMGPGQPGPVVGLALALDSMKDYCMNNR